MSIFLTRCVLFSKSDSASRKRGRAKAFAKRAAARLAPESVLYHAQQALPEGDRVLPGLRSSSDVAGQFSAADELADLLSDRCSEEFDDFLV